MTQPLDGRVLGSVRGRTGGPLLVVVAGIHGNEPAGVAAARRVLDRLQAEATPVQGELLVLLGNRGALQQQRRFVQRDLNRGWTDARLDELRRSPAGRVDEDREQLELLAAIEDALARAPARVFALDLHTTSAEGFPFSIVAGSAGSSDFATGLPLPALRGILERVDGILAEYLGQRGCHAIAVEGGASEDSRSVEHLEAAFTLALARSGLVDPARLPDLPRHRERLDAAARGLPRVIQIHHRHAIRPEDGFAMEPGFANLQRIRAGTLLARDRRGEIRALEDGWLVFPLYQSQGDDGFFLGREMDG